MLQAWEAKNYESWGRELANKGNKHPKNGGWNGLDDINLDSEGRELQVTWMENQPDQIILNKDKNRRMDSD